MGCVGGRARAQVDGATGSRRGRSSARREGQDNPSGLPWGPITLHSNPGFLAHAAAPGPCGPLGMAPWGAVAWILGSPISVLLSGCRFCVLDVLRRISPDRAIRRAPQNGVALLAQRAAFGQRPVCFGTLL